MFLRKFLSTQIVLIFAGLTIGDEKDWWQTTTFYQIYPRSFQDSDGDGIGDLNGITSRLSYLNEIGVGATWLSPIFKSPMADNGYDISDFYEIQPEYGTMEDFDKMIAEAKNLKIKIILDFVPNHSSDECDWFLLSANRTKGYEDYYVWHDGKVDPKNSTNKLPPSNWLSVFGGSAWKWHEGRKQFYYHQFFDKQPDLNYRLPNVREEMKKVLKFWLKRGVDGFRIDAIPHIIEKVEDDGNYLDEPRSESKDANPNSYEYLKHIYTYDQNETFNILYEWRKVLDDALKPTDTTKILLAETNSTMDIKMKYYGNGDHNGSQIPFNFLLLELNEKSKAKDYVGKVNLWMDKMPKNQTANWVLGNHDNPRIADRLGRNRTSLANIFILALPGISVTYYGEEIGMQNVYLPCPKDKRDGERTPMQWDDTTSAGFSKGNKTWLPVALDFKTRNVKIQRQIARSHLNLYKQMQEFRKTEAFVIGTFDITELNENVIKIKRESQSQMYILLINLGSTIEDINPPEIKDMQVVLANEYSSLHLRSQMTSNELTLGPYEAILLEKKKENPKNSV